MGGWTQKDTQRTIGALQLVGGAAAVAYGSEYGGGRGGGYLIGSGIDNLSGSAKGSAAENHRNAGFKSDLIGSFTGTGPSNYGRLGGLAGGLNSSLGSMAGGGSGNAYGGYIGQLQNIGGSIDNQQRAAKNAASTPTANAWGIGAPTKPVSFAAQPQQAPQMTPMPMDQNALAVTPGQMYASATPEDWQMRTALLRAQGVI